MNDFTRANFDRFSNDENIEKYHWDFPFYYLVTKYTFKFQLMSVEADNIKTFYVIIHVPTLKLEHYSDVKMGVMASLITSLTIVYSTVYSDADQWKHQSSASLTFVRGPVNSPPKWPETRKMLPFDDVLMVADL